jgi:hypothetical protein
MRAFKFYRYCLQNLFFDAIYSCWKKCHCIMRAIPWDFWDEVFSLKIWGHFIQQCKQQLQPKVKIAPTTVQHWAYVKHSITRIWITRPKLILYLQETNSIVLFVLFICWQIWLFSTQKISLTLLYENKFT